MTTTTSHRQGHMGGDSHQLAQETERWADDPYPTAVKSPACARPWRCFPHRSGMYDEFLQGRRRGMDEWARNIYAFMELHICEQEPAGGVHELQSRLARPKKSCMTKRWNQNVAHMMEQTGKKHPCMHDLPWKRILIVNSHVWLDVYLQR
jgi:hypothetical protein